MARVHSKQRTISYLRAQWIKPPGMSLEVALRVCMKRCPSVEDTRLPLRNKYAEVRHSRLSRGRVCLHVAAWTEREPASTVPHVSGEQADLGESNPGDTWDYLDGDGMVLVSGDHCLLMPSGLHPRALERYLQCLLEHARGARKARIPEDIERFQLVAVANDRAARRLRREGVKKIHLDIGQYLETAKQDDDEQMTIMQSIGRAVLPLLVKDRAKRRQIEEAANVQAKLIISCDRRRAGLQPEDLTSIAANVSDEDEEYIEIETTSGQRLKRGQLVLRKSVDVAEFGKTVHHGAAWDEMAQYFAYLKEGRMLEE